MGFKKNREHKTMPDNNNGWTERRKKQQACAIRRWKPWEKSTGPQSQVGKKKTSMNALKEGHRAASAKEIVTALRYHRAFLKHMTDSLKADEVEARARNKLMENRMKSKD